jgi:MFS family permease
MLYGLYSALVDGSQKSMVADLVSKDLRGTGYGIYHSVLGITLLPASLIAGLLYDKVNANAPFYFGASMAFIAALLMVVLLVLERKEKAILHAKQASQG